MSSSFAIGPEATSLSPPRPPRGRPEVPTRHPSHTTAARSPAPGGDVGLQLGRQGLQGLQSFQARAQAPQGLGADQDVLAVVQVRGVDAVELLLGVVGVPAWPLLHVLAVLLVGVQARSVGLADLPGSGRGLQGRVGLCARGAAARRREGKGLRPSRYAIRRALTAVRFGRTHRSATISRQQVPYPRDFDLGDKR